MISRINFLLAAAVLVLMVFYLLGRFLLLEAVVAIMPAAAPYFIAAYVLAALMLTVLLLAKSVIRLNSATSVARYRKSGALAVVAQALLVAGHATTVFAVYTSLASLIAGSVSWPWILAGLLYASGVGVTIMEWQKRAHQPA